MTDKTDIKKYTEKEVMELIRGDFDAQNFKDAEFKILQWAQANPANPHCWSYLGFLYSKTKRFMASHIAHKRSVDMQSDNHMFLYNYANSHVAIGKASEGIEYMRKAHDLKPDHELYRQNLSYILRDNCEYDKAEVIQRQLVAEDPDNNKKKFDLGFILLHQRKLDEAWDLYETRPALENRKAWYEGTKEPFEGQDLSGKSLLIVGEQGFGDTILMLRFLPQLIAQAKNITLISRKPLFPLLEQLDITLIEQDSITKSYDTSSYDYGVYMMSLPKIFEKDWLKWPPAPKLKTPIAHKQKIANFFKPRPQQLNVGIVWSGSVTFANNHLRSTTYERFLNLVGQHVNIQFFSMQKGPKEADMLQHGLGAVFPLGNKLDNFGDTSAALEHLDLMVMTDSGLAHLAGSQDVPVLNLLNFLHYWLYTPKATSTTPLYKSWRFIRQEKEGDWDDVFERTSNILKAISDAADQSDKRLDSSEILRIMDDNIPPK